MPDNGTELSRVSTPPGERLAVVETKVTGLQGDTSIMRQTLHSINGKMQEFVLREAECVSALNTIVDNTRTLPTLIGTIQEFQALRPQINKLIEEDQARRGAWGTWVVLGTSITGAIAVITSIILATVTLLRGHAQ